MDENILVKNEIFLKRIRKSNLIFLFMGLILLLATLFFYYLLNINLFNPILEKVSQQSDGATNMYLRNIFKASSLFILIQLGMAFLSGCGICFFFLSKKFLKIIDTKK